MELPKTVKIGVYEYTVVGNAELSEASGLHGESSPRQQRILINPDLPENYLRVVFLHEILHFVFFASGVRALIEMDLEEKLLHVFTASLVDYLQNNDLSWLLKKAENGSLQS